MGCGSSKDVVDNRDSSKTKTENNNNIVIKIEPPKEPKQHKTGDRVHVRGYVGTIKFIGKTQLGEGEWIGIELDKPHPQGNNGAFEDEVYFTCKPKHGLMVRPEAVCAHEEELGQELMNIAPTTIVFIQTKMRRTLAKIRLRKLQERSGNERVIDNHVMGTPEVEEESPNRLGVYLTEPFTRSKDKAYAIYRWLTLNVAYDVEGFFGKDSKKSCEAEDVLKNKLSVCAGYANLFEAMGKAAGLEIHVVCGYAKGYGYQPGQKIQGTNHAWNALRIDDQWYLSDATWGAGNLGNDMMFHREPNSFRFLMDPEYAILDHLPEEEKWQCLEEPVSKETFEKTAVISGAMNEMGIELLSHKELLYNIDSDCIEMTFYCPGKKMILMGKIKDNSGQVLPGKERVQIRPCDINQVKMCAQFPAPGSYTVDIYVNVEGSWTHGVSYVVKPTKGCGEDKGGFPQIAGTFYENGFDLVSPLENIETNNGKAEVKLECYSRRFLSIFGNVLGVNEAERNMVKNQSLCFSEVINSGFLLKVDTPGPGNYMLNIFAEEDNGEKVFLCKYYITNTEKKQREVVGFPQISDDFDSFELKLLEPLENIVSSDGRATIKLKSTADISRITFTSQLRPDSSISLQLQPYQKLSFCEKSDDIITVIVDAPKPGLYSLFLFGDRNTGERIPAAWLCTYKIYSQVTKERPVFGFPWLSHEFIAWEMEWGLQLEGPKENIHSHDGNAQIVLKCAENISSLICNLLKDEQTINDCYTVNDDEDKNTKIISIKLPSEGLFNLNVFGKRKNQDKNVHLVSYVIYSDKSSSD